MANQRKSKKKNVSHSKYSNAANLSFNELKNEFESLQKQALYSHQNWPPKKMFLQVWRPRLKKPMNNLRN